MQLGKFMPVIGGVERVMFDLCWGLNSYGIDCDMLCVEKEPVLTDKEYNILSNKIILCKKNLEIASTMISLSMIFKLRRYCKNYDIIHIHHPDPMAALALFLSGYKGKVVLHWHSDIIRQKTILRFYKYLQTWLIKRADLILGTTPAYIEQSPYLKDYQDKCSYHLIGVDRVKARIDLVNEIKKKYKGKKIVFSVGRLVPYKGYEDLIEAAKYINKDVVIVIGGRGPLMEELRLKIDKEGLRHKVDLMGFVLDDYKHAFYEASDIFCLSSVSKTEAYAIVQVEAMAMSKPVIATNIEGSGVPWVNKDGVSGINVPVNNPKAIAEAINKLTSDKELYKRMSLGAKDRYEKLFRKKDMISNIINIYDNLYEK